MPLTALALLGLAAPSSFQAPAAGPTPVPPALAPGAKAPALEVGGWLKQDAPKSQKGRLRVVEFWATWCVPCKAAMPHLSELARKYRDRLDVVGVSVLEYPQATLPYIKRFVDGMGDGMDYRVAYDTPKGTMAKTWLTAAGLDSIPSTFLLDDAGSVLWIGHPNGLEAQLEAAFAGKLDVGANRAAFLTASNWFEKSTAALAKAADAYKAGRKDEAERIWNETQATWPRAGFMVRRARLGAYPFGTPESAAVVDAMIAGNVVERETVVKFAMALPKGERARAEALVDRAAEAKADDTLLYVVAVAYSRLEAYAKAVRIADAALAQIDASLADPRYAPLKPMIEQNRANFKKVRDEAAAKATSHS